MSATAAMSAGKPAVWAERFSFTYANAVKPAVESVDWKVEAGAFHLLVGATGSGKTTLLRCLDPALAPAGTRVGKLETQDGGTQYVAQDPESQIVCDSVWHEIAFGLENLGTPAALMRRRVAEVAHFFGIEPWFRRETHLLSGGQKQLVALASALAMAPGLLLLDEPTAQLDPVAEKNFLHALFRINRELGVTVVVATHSPEAMLDYATEISELANGRMTSRTAPTPPEKPAPPAPGKLRRPAGRRSPDAADIAVRLRDVHLRYSRTDDWVLRGCELAVARGSIHVLVGGNGSGKTTVLNAIAGTGRIERGHVENRLASRQVLLPQNPKALFTCDTAEEELLEWQRACGYDDEAVEEALRTFDLCGQRRQHPYDLSGGQQQKLALAKLLLANPELLLLDEPTKGLDAASKLAVAHALSNAVAEGATAVLATHDLAFAAALADEVTLLFDGEAACTEDAATFFEGNLFYRPPADAFASIWKAEADTEADKENPRP